MPPAQSLRVEYGDLAMAVELVGGVVGRVCEVVDEEMGRRKYRWLRSRVELRQQIDAALGALNDKIDRIADRLGGDAISPQLTARDQTPSKGFRLWA